MEKWKNYGDINFVAYGGCLVRPHFTIEELKNEENAEENRQKNLDVLCLMPGDEDNIYYGYISNIDFRYDVSQEDLAEMCIICGYDEFAQMPIEEMLENGMTYNKIAVELAQTIDRFRTGLTYKSRISVADTMESMQMTYEELCEWLRDVGAEEYIPEEG